MSKMIAVFEGIVDYNSGWLYDMPVIMMAPIFRFGSHIDIMIEAYLTDYLLEQDYDDEFEKEETKREYQRAFELAKNNQGALSYWRRLIEWDTETFEITEIDRTDPKINDDITSNDRLAKWRDF